MRVGISLFSIAAILCAWAPVATPQYYGPLLPANAPAIGLGGFSGGFAESLTAEPIRFYVGWMEPVRNAYSAFDQEASGTGTAGSHDWPVAGLWLGAAKSISLGERCALGLDGWLLIPANREAIERDEFNRVIAGGGRIRALTVTTTPVVRTWETYTDWWYADAEVGCRLSGGFMVFGGFRYEHFSTRFKNPGIPAGTPGSSDDNADITVNGYLPYIGVQLQQGGSTSLVSIRALGFPYVPADVQHLETGETGTGLRTEATGAFSGGYFVELLGEYRARVFGGPDLGAFVKYNVFHGRGNLNLDVTDFPSSSSGFAFHRESITFGGTFSLDFALPF
ncbi:MAG: hypothetical protein FJ118_09595 [Deltaproteobacteria bacterium]|nr:hypothetical protein [Deltaproteobacteria bacterium]